MLNKKHIKYFEKLVGKENVYSDKAHLIAYSYDATRTRYEPEAVVFPRNEEDVSALLKYCNEHQVIITPQRCRFRLYRRCPADQWRNYPGPGKAYEQDP